MSGTDVLFLAHRLPYPPDRGDRIRSWHMLKALAQLRPVHVVAPVDDAEDNRYRVKVEAVAESVTTAVRPADKGLAVLRALVSGLPASVTLFSVPHLHQAVRRHLAGGRIGTIVAFSGQMAHYVPTGTRQTFVMDFVDVDSAKFAQLADNARGLPKLALQIEARRLLAFETATAKRAHASLFVSEAEAALFNARTGLSASVVENGVDTDHFRPGAVDGVASAQPLIVFTGQMDYPPNVEAVTRFATEVLPLISSATFAIVGRSPTAAVRALAADNVIVTGEVPDTRPWIAAADVVVAPLLLARGVQNKVLEAMAMAKPVVASSGAARGIDAIDGEAIVVADTADAQADAINALLADRAYSKRIGAAARSRVLARYAWEARLAPLAELIA